MNRVKALSIGNYDIWLLQYFVLSKMKKEKSTFWNDDDFLFYVPFNII